MSFGTADDHLPRARSVELVTVGISSYPHLPEINVDATTSCEAIAKTLTSHGVTIHEDWSKAAAKRGSIETRLAEWCERRGSGSILYWCAHGEQTEDGYRTLLGNARRSRLKNVLKDNDFAEYLRSRSTQDTENWSLLILDTCASVHGAWKIYDQLNPLGPPPRNVGIIGTSSREGATHAGEFPRLLAEKLAEFTVNDERITMIELLRRFENPRLGRRLWYDFTEDAQIPHPRGGSAIQATQDSYIELERVLAEASPEARDHFYAKAQGAETGELAWHFRGRDTERAAIVAWLNRAHSGMFVLTGVAGSGKSAVLGMILAASNPDVVDALVELGYPPIMPNVRPQAGTFTATAHLSGRTIGEATANLATQLGHPETTNPEQLIEAVNASEGAAILVDALDEARDPYPIASLLRRLASLDHVKVLVGTRQSLHEAPDTPQLGDRALLDALGAPQSPDEKVIRLERDQTAILGYAFDRLKRGLPEGLPERNAIVNRLATAISGYDQPFLFARLAVHEAIADRHWQDRGADLDDLLSHGHTGIFDRAVNRIKAENPQVEALLHSLAYAQGNGYPRTDGIWATAAQALLDQPVTDDNIGQALRLAAPYIMLGSEFGSSTYRLAHRTFAERYIQLDTAS